MNEDFTFKDEEEDLEREPSLEELTEDDWNNIEEYYTTSHEDLW